MYESVFNFFGYIISINVNKKYINNQIRYIYKHYLIEKVDEKKIDYYFRIVINSDTHFLVSDLLTSKKVIVLHGKSKEDLKTWDSKHTFLPPITSDYFENKFSFFHGCAIRYFDITYGIFGQSRSGKTSLAIDLMDKGAKLISDDLIIIDNKTSKVYPFKKPLGIRNTSSFFYQDKIKRAKRKQPEDFPTFFIKKLNLKTELIHAEDVIGWQYYELPTIINKILIFDKFGEGDLTGEEFIKKMLQFNYQSNNILVMLGNLYNNLDSKPKYIKPHTRSLF